MNTIRIMSGKGDTPFQYNPETQLDMARARARALQEENYTLFSIDPATKDAIMIDELFQEHVEVLAVPQIAGG